jgi:hypothetical protein
VHGARNAGEPDRPQLSGECVVCRLIAEKPDATQLAAKLMPCVRHGHRALIARGPHWRDLRRQLKVVLGAVHCQCYGRTGADPPRLGRCCVTMRRARPEVRACQRRTELTKRARQRIDSRYAGELLVDGIDLLRHWQRAAGHVAGDSDLELRKHVAVGIEPAERAPAMRPEPW